MNHLQVQLEVQMENILVVCISTVYWLLSVYNYLHRINLELHTHVFSWYSVLYIIFQLSPDKVKNSEIEMKPNRAYETVTLPYPSRSTTQVHTEPCPAYEYVVQAHH